MPLVKDLDRSDVMAIMALVISIFALVVSIVEADIMRDQQEIMQSQQRAAVWPYLESNFNIITTSEKLQVIYELENKGIGPARLSSNDLSANGEEIDTYNELFDRLVDALPDNITPNLRLASLNNVVLSAGDKIEILGLETEVFSGAGELIRQLEIEFSCCYCSIYKECWRLDRVGATPQEGCLMNDQ